MDVDRAEKGDPRRGMDVPRPLPTASAQPSPLHPARDQHDQAARKPSLIESVRSAIAEHGRLNSASSVGSGVSPGSTEPRFKPSQQQAQRKLHELQANVSVLGENVAKQVRVC